MVALFCSWLLIFWFSSSLALRSMKHFQVLCSGVKMNQAAAEVIEVSDVSDDEPVETPCVSSGSSTIDSVEWESLRCSPIARCSEHGLIYLGEGCVCMEYNESGECWSWTSKRERLQFAEGAKTAAASHDARSVYMKPIPKSKVKAFHADLNPSEFPVAAVPEAVKVVVEPLPVEDAKTDEKDGVAVTVDLGSS